MSMKKIIYIYTQSLAAKSAGFVLAKGNNFGKKKSERY